MTEHRDKLQISKGALWDHAVQCYNGVAPEYSYRVVKAFNDPLLRQLQEAQRIQQEPGVLLNGKEELIPPAAYRVSVTRM